MNRFISFLLVFSLTHLLSFGSDLPYIGASKSDEVTSIIPVNSKSKSSFESAVIVERSPRKENPNYKAFLVGLRLQDTINDMMSLSHNLDMQFDPRHSSGRSFSISANLFQSGHMQNFRRDYYTRGNVGAAISSIIVPKDSCVMLSGISGVLVGQAANIPESLLYSLSGFFSCGMRCALATISPYEGVYYVVTLSGKTIAISSSNTIVNEYYIDCDNIGSWKSSGALAEIGTELLVTHAAIPWLVPTAYVKLQGVNTVQQGFKETSREIGRVFSDSFYRSIDLPIGGCIKLAFFGGRDVLSLDSSITLGLKQSFADTVISYGGDTIAVISPTEWAPLIKSDAMLSYTGEATKGFLWDLVVSLGSRRNLYSRDSSACSETSYLFSLNFGFDVTF